MTKVKEWKKVRLADVGKLTMGQSPPGSSYNDLEQGTPLLNGAVELRTNGIQISKYTTAPARIAERGDLLFCIRATIGNLNVADTQYCLGRGVAGLRVNEGYSRSLIGYYLESLFGQMKRYSQGGVIKGLKKEEVGDFSFSIPSSLKDQEKLADILDTSSRTISLTKSAIAQTSKLKSGLMQEFFSVDDKTTVKKIRDIADVRSGGTPNRGNKIYWNGGTIPWVKTAEINYTRISHTSEYITEAGLKNSAARLFPSGTILMAMYGQGKTRGKVAILDIEAATNQACAAFLIRDKRVLTEYLYYYFEHSYERLRREAHGANQKNLSGDILKEQKVPILPLEKQAKMIDVLKQIDYKIATEKSYLRSLEKLKLGLLQDLLTGRVGV